MGGTRKRREAATREKRGRMSRIYTGSGRLFQEVQAVELDTESLQDIRRRVKLQPQFLGEPLVVIGESRDFAQLNPESMQDLLALDVLGRAVLIGITIGVADGDAQLSALRFAAQIAPLNAEELGKIARSFIARPENDNLRRHWDELEVEMSDEAVELGSLLAATFARDAGDYAESINSDQRIILAAEGFTTNLVATVQWLVRSGVDIVGLRYRKFVVGGQEIYFAEQVVPMRDVAVDALEKPEAPAETVEPWKAKGRAYHLERLTPAIGALLDQLLVMTREATFALNWSHKYYFWLRGVRRNLRVRTYVRDRLEIGFYNAAPEAVEEHISRYGLNAVEVYTLGGYTDSPFIALTSETRLDDKWRAMLTAWMAGGEPVAVSRPE